jgi:hypothetical protein
LTAFIDYLKNELPSYEEIAFVERNATSPKDPLWTHMVNHLCHDRFKDLFPDPVAFAAFLEGHPRLKTSMHDADMYFANVGKQRWEHRQSQYEAERRSQWERNQAEKHELLSREKQASESLRQKIDEKGGSGLIMATAEGAILLRNR